MSKAIFFNIPASGHINPSLPLTAELVRRGETIIYYGTENFRAKIEATGAAFRPYQHFGDDYFGAPPMNGSNPPLAAARIIATTRDALGKTLREAGGVSRAADLVLELVREKVGGE